MKQKLSDVDLIELAMIMEARESFWAYRQLMHPKMKRGWWQREISKHLQQFYEDFIAVKRPKLAIEAPPQHGKTEQIVDFITWVAGKNPDLKAIYTSFSERLGIRANLNAQRIYDSPKYKKIFPETQINSRGSSTQDSGQSIRNREMIEYVNAEGFFRNTTVRGSITGESLNIGIIDDPIKGREEAGSKTVRDKTWDWLTDDFFTRFSEDGALLAIMTRWHIDDPIGRLRIQMPDALKVVSYPAIATEKEKYRDIGEPLFPQHKSLEFLLERKSTMAKANWESLFQQNPQIVGGELIHGEDFGRYKEPPILTARWIYADTALKTKEHHDFSVLQCWGKGDDGKLYLLDIVRGKWEAPELRRRAIAFWAKHKALDSTRMGDLRAMKIEDKASGTGLIQELISRDRIPVEAIQRDKDKYTRLMDVLGYIESGFVMVPEDAGFISDFLDECESFTSDDSHQHDDQIDPMIDAIKDQLSLNNALAEWENL